MRIFLSAMENTQAFNCLRYIQEREYHIHDALISYYYLEKGKPKPQEWQLIFDNCDKLMVDSGAHSFQVGKTVDWYTYTERYAQWVADHDSDPRYVGFFEMDVDVVLGYEKVKELQKILFQASDKIIPVWHKNRGIDEFKRMCHETKGDIVAITGFHNEDIMDKQYPMFLNYAWKCGKKVHCLGMTRSKVLDRVPFNYVDSSSWKQYGNYGSRIFFKNGKIKTKKVKGRYTTNQLDKLNLVEYLKLVDYYNVKWNKVNHDLYTRFEWLFEISSPKTILCGYYEIMEGVTHETTQRNIGNDKGCSNIRIVCGYIVGNCSVWVRCNSVQAVGNV